MSNPEFAHVSFARVGAQQSDVERCYREWWLPEITTLDEATGKRVFSLAKLKGELFDMHHLIINARAVYAHVTDGACKDLTASAEGIIAQAEAKIEERIEAEVQRRIAQRTHVERRAAVSIQRPQ